MNEESKSNKVRNIALGSIAATVLVPVIIAVIENGGIDLLRDFLTRESPPPITSAPSEPITPEPPEPITPKPPEPIVVLKEIIFFEKNGIKEVCANLPAPESNVVFHAWRSDGSGIDLPMNSTSESSCMYWINLPAGAEGGTLKTNGNYAAVGSFLVRAESGCSEAVTINEGIIKASTSPNSSLLDARDSVNGDSGKWGWACK